MYELLGVPLISTVRVQGRYYTMRVRHPVFLCTYIVNLVFLSVVTTTSVFLILSTQISLTFVPRTSIHT
jgi:hypothetical protein